MAEIPSRFLYESPSSQIFLDKTSGDPPKVIKRFLSTSPDLSRFEECDRHRKCASATPGVVRYIDKKTNGQFLELMMDYCEEGSLASVIEERKQTERHWTEPNLLVLYGDMMETLRAVHNQRIVHRVVVAENWLITASGSAKLTDFGHAKLIPQNTSQNPHQMADGTFSRRIFGEDVRFLANVFFHMATLNRSVQLFSLSEDGIRSGISGAGYSENVSFIIMKMNRLGTRMRQVEVARLLEELQYRPYNQLVDYEDFGLEGLNSPAVFDPECSYCWALGAWRVLTCGHTICTSCEHDRRSEERIKCNLCGRLVDFEARKEELTQVQIGAVIEEAHNYYFHPS